MIKSNPNGTESFGLPILLLVGLAVVPNIEHSFADNVSVD